MLLFDFCHFGNAPVLCLLCHVDLGSEGENDSLRIPGLWHLRLRLFPTIFDLLSELDFCGRLEKFASLLELLGESQLRSLNL